MTRTTESSSTSTSTEASTEDSTPSAAGGADARPAGTAAAPAGADDRAWWTNNARVPPVIDQEVTKGIRLKNSAEVGQCGLVSEQEAQEANRSRASSAQFSQRRIKANIAAQQEIGTPKALAKAAVLQRQLVELDDLNNTSISHGNCVARYGYTIQLRQRCMMDQTRGYEQDIHAQAATEKQKAQPDPKILAADELITAAQQKDQADKLRTKQDGESRTSDQDRELAQVRAQLAEAHQVMQQQQQLMDQLQQKLLLVGGASGGTTAATHAKHPAATPSVTAAAPASAPSSANRRNSPR